MTHECLKNGHKTLPEDNHIQKNVQLNVLRYRKNVVNRWIKWNVRPQQSKNNLRKETGNKPVA
jgi:hypothetical protein